MWGDMEHLAFLVGFGFLTAHELDAVKCREWRIHPFFSWMSDSAGYIAFVAAHVPLYVLLLWAIFGTQIGGANEAVVFWLNVFMIVHVALNVGFLLHPKNEFRSAFSCILIIGAGVAGAVDLAIT